MKLRHPLLIVLLTLLAACASPAQPAKDGQATAGTCSPKCKPVVYGGWVEIGGKVH